MKTDEDRRTLTAAPADKGLRLDVWLAGRMSDTSRSRVQALIREGHVTHDGTPVRARQAVRAGMVVNVHIPPPEPAVPVAQAIHVPVIHEDADVIVVNKPPGLVVHPAAGHASGTLVNALLHHCKDLAGIGGERRPGIVHRLDKDTSGVMVVAKRDSAMRSLVEQFKTGRVRKHYLALVYGVPVPATGTIETLIGRNPHDRKKMSARPVHGRNAISHYRLIQSFRTASLLTVHIETGRTHQIRVHLAHIGHPVLGDKQYGRSKPRLDPATPIGRQMLHAQRLAFDHPRSGERVNYEAHTPADMQALIQTMSTRGT